MAMLMVGRWTGVHAVEGLSLLPTVVGATSFLAGVGVTRAVLMPVTMVAFSLSLYRGLLSSLGFALQDLTARGSAALAGIAGVAVREDGVNLYAGSFHFAVTQACSGMDSLLALLCLGLAFVGIARTSLTRRAALLATILPIILVANVNRVTLVLVLSRPFGLAVAQGLPHAALSVFLFFVATLLFLLAGLVLRCVPKLGIAKLSFSS